MSPSVSNGSETTQFDEDVDVVVHDEHVLDVGGRTKDGGNGIAHLPGIALANGDAYVERAAAGGNDVYLPRLANGGLERRPHC